ncbi:MAG TPA: SpoIIE family protein phosphatase, partial [Stenomitos sp.]
ASSRWSGFQHGIKQIDRVIAIDGVPVKDGTTLYREVAARPPGTNIRYTVVRTEGLGSETLDLTVPSQRFNLFDFFGFFFAFWIVGIFHILVGMFVSIVKPGDKTARAHLLFCIFFATFFLTNFDGISSHVFSMFPHNEAFSLIAAFGLNLAFYVPRPIPFIERHRWIKTANLVLGVAFTAFILWSHDHNRIWPFAFMALTAATSVATLAIPVTSIWARFSKTSSEQVKKQATLILWGALVAFVAPITINGLAFAGIVLPFGELSYYTFFIFAVVVAYTIVRHRLFDIDVIIKRTVTYTIVTVALTAGYFIVTAGIRSLFGTGSEWTNVVATGAVAVTFAPLRDRTKVLVDKLFFRTGYDLAQLLTDFGDRARETFDATELLRLFVKTIEFALYPQFVAVLLKDQTTGRLVQRESLGLEYGQRLDMSPDHPVLKGLLQDQHLSVNTEPVDVDGLSQATVLPLRLKDELVGLVLVGPRKSDLNYTFTDRTLLVSLCQQLALWVKNAQLFTQLASQERLKRELEIAHEVQSGLLRTSLPALDGVEFSATSIPALEVGGDFYDIIPVDEHRIGILIGDVSGKGVPAALLMAMTLVIFRSIAGDNPSSADVMAKANELIYLNRPSKKMFVTAFYAIYDARDRSLTFSNAGNPMPMEAKGGTTGRLEAKGVSLGMFPSIGYEENRGSLKEGEVIVFYSDGAEDAINPTSEQFGEERLAEIVAANVQAPARQMESAILDAIRHFSEGSDQFDDITLVTLKAN